MPDASKRIFVETTIHIWRHTATDASKRRIEGSLKSRQCVTSTYVEAEYVNTYLRAAVEAYNCIVASDNFEDALGRWERYYASQYKLGIRFLINAIFSDNNEKADALRRLRELIEQRLMLPFDPRAQMFDVVDPTQCAAAYVRPHLTGNVYMLTLEFPPGDAPPGLKIFLSQKHSLLSQVETSITSNDKHWGTIKAGLQMLLRGEYNLGLRKWQRMADVVIALEAQHTGCELYSGNVRHFELICHAMQIPFRSESRE